MLSYVFFFFFNCYKKSFVTKPENVQLIWNFWFFSFGEKTTHIPKLWTSERSKNASCFGFKFPDQITIFLIQVDVFSRLLWGFFIAITFFQYNTCIWWPWIVEKFSAFFFLILLEVLRMNFFWNIGQNYHVISTSVVIKL